MTEDREKREHTRARKVNRKTARSYKGRINIFK